PTDNAVWQSATKLLPGSAAIGRLIDSTSGPAILQPPGTSHTFVGGGIKRAGVAAVNYQVDDAGLIVEVENFLPGDPAICTLEYTALFVSREEVSHGGDVNDVRISWMNHNPRDVLRVLEPHELPIGAAIDRLVYAITRIRTASA